MIQPTLDRVLVKPSAAPQRTGSIIHAEIAERKPQTGTVVAVGPGMRDKKGRRWPVPVSVGEKVVWKVHCGTEYTEDGVTYLILREEDLVVALEARA
jgi:chaperonin GroES